jgi:flagellar biosynthesis/type III secretory pathway protein FliH
MDINEEARKWARSQFSSDPDDYEELYYLGLEHGYKAGHNSKATQAKVIQAQIDILYEFRDYVESSSIFNDRIFKLQQQLKELEDE